MNKLLLSFAGILSATLLFSSAVFATDAGQIEAGNIYKAKNQTADGVFEDPTSATCGDTVKLRVEIHNPGPGVLKNVKVAATVPTGVATSHTSTVTVSSPNANPASVSDTAGIKLDKAGKLAYVAGSAEYFSATGARLGSIADSIVAGGATIPGEVGVSFDHRRYVQFRVKVDCPTKPPVEEKIKVCELATKKIITINAKDFDRTKHSKRLADCATVPPKEDEITVCETKTGNIVNIKEGDFDSSKHTKDLSVCADEEAPVTEEEDVVAAELPQTGANGLLAGLGLSTLAAGAAYALQRRNTLG